jgi:hypothetical protein
MSDYFPPPYDSSWDLIAPDMILPCQLERRTNESDIARIAVRTFRQAIEDVQHGARCIDEHRCPEKKRNHENLKRVIRDYRDALEWFNDDVKAGFSFCNLCDFLGLNEPLKIRARMNEYQRDLNEIEWRNL